jgi:alkylated DNA repair dioxygenase AlkB
LVDERLFKLHHKKRKETLDISLGHGDLLVMERLSSEPLEAFGAKNQKN